jgi:hypothetical protein
MPECSEYPWHTTDAVLIISSLLPGPHSWPLLFKADLAAQVFGVVNSLCAFDISTLHLL